MRLSRALIVVCALLCGVAPRASGAVAVEAVGGVSGTGVSSLTVTGFTVTSANLMLIGVSLGDGTAASAQTFSVVWNGAQSATQVPSSGAIDGSPWSSVVWYQLDNPTATTANLVVSFQIGGSASNPNQSAVHVITFTGANTTLGTPNTNTGTSTNPSVTVADSASGEIVVAVVSNDNEGGTTKGSGTVIFDTAGTPVGGDTDHSSFYDTSSGSPTVMSWTNGGSGNGWASSGLAVASSGPATTLDQEGFRWGIDDGNEASHTFEAAQDTNISIADNQSRLLRTLVNATLDPASAAYTLRYQKNGSGGYVAVPVGSTTPGSITNQTVAASSDDAQQVSGTVTLTGTTIGSSLDATTEWAGMRFTNIAIPAGATITAAQVEVVPSATTEDEPLVTVYMEAADDCATFTTTASDISNRSRTTGVSWSSTDLGATGSSYHNAPSLVTDFQAVIDRAGWASGNDVCVIIQGGATSTRDLTIEAQDLGPNTNPPRLSVSWTTPNQVYVTTSANITAGGEATTARLTAPSGKTTSDFVTGRRWDDENGTDSIDITTDDYTEVEWLVFIASSAADGDFFDFRTYAGSSPLDTYTVTPRWSIPVPGGGSIIPLISNNRRRQMH